MTVTQTPVPGGTIQHRKLEFFWLVDCSGSMNGRKITSLNFAISEAIPAIKRAAAENPHIQVEMRAIRFSDRAEWHVGPDPVPLSAFSWTPLQPGGMTATAEAIRLLAEQLTLEKMPQRGVPPVCILVSDGHCTNTESEYKRAIDSLTRLPWGAKAVRLAIGMGEEGEYNEEELLYFVSHKEIGVLKANTPQKLVNYIHWVSTVATASSSQGQSAPANVTGAQHAVYVPPPPPALANLPTGNIAPNNPF